MPPKKRPPDMPAEETDGEKSETKTTAIVRREDSAPAHLAGPTAEALIAQAIDRNIPVETMERLMAMRRELKAEAAEETRRKPGFFVRRN